MPLIRPIVLALTILMCGSIAMEAAADRVRVDLPDGTRWRGESGMQVTVTYATGRRTETVTGVLKSVEPDWLEVVPNGEEDEIIFLSDLRSIDEAAGDAKPADPAPAGEDDTADESAQVDGSGASDGGTADDSKTSNPDLSKELQYDLADGMPVYYLPM